MDITGSLVGTDRVRGRDIRRISTLVAHEIAHTNSIVALRKALRKKPQYANLPDDVIDELFTASQAPYASSNPRTVATGARKIYDRFAQRGAHRRVKQLQRFRRNGAAEPTPQVKTLDSISRDMNELRVMFTPEELNAMVASYSQHYGRLVRKLHRVPTAHEFLYHVGEGFRSGPLHRNPRALQHFVKRMHREGMPITTR